MGWPTPGCAAAIAAMGTVVCSKPHCDDIANYLHNYCACKLPPYTNPCPMNADTPVMSFNPDGSLCACCCMCFAWGTPIAVPKSDVTPEGYKPIEQFAIGDPVMVADAQLNWSVLPVEYSNGTGTDAFMNLLIAVGYEVDGKAQSLLVTPNNLFLMPNGKLKRADRLVPEKDNLVLADKRKVPVKAVATGSYKKGVHHIATAATTVTTVDGHLLNANGVVSADYALQISGIDLDNGLMDAASMAEPEFGTRAYGEKHRALVRDNFHVSAPGFDLAAALPPDFTLLANAMTRLPEGAHRFISQAQADDIEANRKALRYPAASNIGNDYAHYFFKVYGAFFPTVNFLIDPSNESPNAYSFRDDSGRNVNYVIVTGGLLRMKSIKFEAVSAVIAHELGHLFGGDPLNESKYTCEAAADYTGMGSIMRSTWYGTLYAMAGPARAQIAEFFSYIDPQNAGGMPGNRCDEISIDCRLEAMSAAMAMMPLPYCAGGDPVPFLRLTGAQAAPGTAQPAVTLTFNTAVDPATGSDLANYSLAPGATIVSAGVDPKDGKLVRLEAEIESGVEYTITVENLLSTKDEILVNGENTATFTLAAAP